MLGAELRARGVTTFLSHASLSLDERRRAEQAFADGRDCVIVATSTLELGHRRRRPRPGHPDQRAADRRRVPAADRAHRPAAGTVRNCCSSRCDEGRSCSRRGCCWLWGRGFVEPVAAPPEPRHIVAQQLLALCLQEGRVGDKLWQEWLPLPSLPGSRRSDR